MQTLHQLRAGELKGQTSLKLNCGLTEFPDELFSLANSLELLDLSGNFLSELPSNFCDLHQLKIAFFSDNRFSTLPEVLGKCPKLEMIGFKSNRINHVSEKALPPTTRWLILTNNQINELPKSIGNCKPLQKVALAGNRLSQLPQEMSQCTNLELLRISANNFQELPHWLLDMPKLAWLAFSGNPLCKHFATPKAPQVFDWNRFTVLEKLGEGASGNIYKAVQTTQQSKFYAIKVFKGEVTSDGFPQDELNTCLMAEHHPNIVNVLGVIGNHPEKKQALVMDLIPSNYFNLGNPPSFKSCTRDTFNPDTFFSLHQILSIASGMAKAILHLHHKGIVHGDLYAHNTLFSEAGGVLTGDFGAASYFDIHSQQGKKLQQIETRAFGCLLDDLLSRCIEYEKSSPVYSQLAILKDDCLSLITTNRPLFQTIVNRLQTVGKTH